GTGTLFVGGGVSASSLTVAGSGALTVLDQNPPAGEDPVLNRAIVGGYLTDGLITVSSGTLTTPNLKLGLTSGNTGMYVQTGGDVHIGVLSAGNNADLTTGQGFGMVHISGGTMHVDTILLGSSTGGVGHLLLDGTGTLIISGGK